MEANELMIGDLVKAQGYDKLKVKDLCHTYACFPNRYHGILYEKLEPIPLTAEILEKNGFKKYGDTGWWLEDDYYDIQIYEWSDSIWVFKYESTEMNTPYEQRTFSYVHNLQHALRECGIDKEIVL